MNLLLPLSTVPFGESHKAPPSGERRGLHQGRGKQNANWMSASTFPLDRLTLGREQLAQLTVQGGMVRCVKKKMFQKGLLENKELNDLEITGKKAVEKEFDT